MFCSSESLPRPSKSSSEQVGTNLGVMTGSTSFGPSVFDERTFSTKLFAASSDASGDDSTYVLLDDLSIESFPTKARIPSVCMTSAKIKLLRKLTNDTSSRLISLLDATYLDLSLIVPKRRTVPVPCSFRRFARRIYVFLASSGSASMRSSALKAYFCSHCISGRCRPVPWYRN